MGMFDDVTCNYPLPIDGQWGMEWQTKSLDCTLSRYCISTGGGLYVEREDDWEPVELPPFFVLEMHAARNGLWISVSVLFLNGKVDQVDVRTEALSGNPADLEPGFSFHDPTA